MSVAAALPAEAGASLQLHNVALGYLGRPVISGLDLVLREGTSTAIIGPNGSGKSTLLRALAGELRPMAGHIAVAGLNGRAASFLQQSPEIDRSVPVSVRDFAAMGLWRRVGALGGTRSFNAEIDAAFGAVGLADLAGKPIGHLSGGQLQRALFARLILEDARLILLDEPFAAIDQETAADLSALLRRWHGEGRTIVAALHDLDQVRRSLGQTLRLSGGRAQLGPTAQMLSVMQLPRDPAPDAPDPSGGNVA